MPEQRTRVLLLTEGTYPYELGGVSSWCDLLVRELTEFDWHVLPIIAAHGRAPLYALPPHARALEPIEVWSQRRPPGRRGGRPEHDLPAILVRELLGWEGDTDAVVAAWLRCRLAPAGVRAAFRSTQAWHGYLDALAGILAERVPEAGTPPQLDLIEAAELYQSLYWIARTAAAPTPEVDVLHATAAGWSAVPATVHRALHGTPMILTEHGVYLREAYLAAVRRGESPGRRFAATRLARGLTRVAYAHADAVAPVTDANAHWETGLGLEAERICVIRNGLRSAPEPAPPPGTSTIVSVGRIDPLKDIHTMLRAAARTIELVPDARFRHYGLVTPGEEAYGRSCELLHERLGLGDRFRFMGRTTDPGGVVRGADVVLMTSISEGMPMAILEAMGEGRPVVATRVGGVPDVVRGCGLIAAPVKEREIALALVTLLRNPELAARLGRLGYRRLGRLFDQAGCVEGYRRLLRAAAAGRGEPVPAPMPLAVAA
jgi:glycosyltransferase involved in cell wall biosynthesis